MLEGYTSRTSRVTQNVHEKDKGKPCVVLPGPDMFAMYRWLGGNPLIGAFTAFLGGGSCCSAVGYYNCSGALEEGHHAAFAVAPRQMSMPPEQQ